MDKRKVTLLFILGLPLFALTACSGIGVDDLQGDWVEFVGYEIFEDSETVELSWVEFTIADEEIVQYDLTADFELSNNSLTINQTDSVPQSFLAGQNDIVLDGDVLTVNNEVTHFRRGSSAYEDQRIEWQAMADEALCERFCAVWEWREEVEEVISEFEATVIGFEPRLEEEITAMLVGYTWRPYSSVSGADFTETFYDADATGVIFLEDGTAITTGSGWVEPFVDYFAVQVLNPPRESSWELIYDFNTNLEANFSVRFSEGRVDWYDYERITGLTLIRDMSVETIENRLFLDELRLEIDLMTAVTIESLLEQDEEDTIVGVRITILAEGSEMLFNSPSLSVLFTGDTLISSNGLGGANRYEVTYRRQPNDPTLISELLNDIEGEAERQETVAEVMQDLVGTWVQIDIDEPSEWNPTGITETQFVITCSTDFEDCTTVHNHYAVISQDERERMSWSQGHDLSLLHLSTDLRHLNQMNTVFGASASTSEFSINGNLLQLRLIRMYGMTDVTYLNTDGEDIRLEGTLYTGDEVQRWTDFAFELVGNTDENIYVKTVDVTPVNWVRCGSPEHLELLQDVLN